MSFQEYIKQLRSHPLDKITEQTHRSALESLLRSVANKYNPETRIQHEPKRQGSFGAPDFLVYTDASIIGYVENKKPAEHLDKIINGVQIKKYLELSSNILITNYLEFVWIKKNETDERSIKRETLCYLSDIENRKFKLDKNKVDAVEFLLKSFFSQPPRGVNSVKGLSCELAIRCHHLREFLTNELKEEQENKDNRCKVYGLYDTFKEHIFNELTIEEFADAFAQMLVYGLFLAKLDADDNKINFTNAREYIPSSFKLIKELVDFIRELKERSSYKEIVWVVEEVFNILNHLDLLSIKGELSFGKRKTKSENDFLHKDPYIYFYEDFLADYDKKMRKDKGIYYTPLPVVSFIIRAVNNILGKTFSIPDGLADYKKVTLLDFATGTGTFLLETLKQIFTSLPAGSGRKQLLIKEHILKNFYGFECLIAPYTIAHIKLSQFLKDNGYTMGDEERLQIYLTNTLDPTDEKTPEFLLPSLSEEGKSANKIREKPILVITGNPPYNVKSKNKGEWIKKQLQVYKQGLAETRINLDDDYIKFIRYGEYMVNNTGDGVLAYISNNSFLSGLTHRQMRKHLLQTFDKIYILDLHGDARIKETTPMVIQIKMCLILCKVCLLTYLSKLAKRKKGIWHKCFITTFMVTEKANINFCGMKRIKT